MSNDPWAIITSQRPAFAAHVGVLKRSFALAIDAAAAFGLRPNPRAYVAVDRQRAAAILRVLLRYDLAYGTELIAAKLAEEMVSAWLAEMPTDARFFTNGNWDEWSGESETQMAVGIRWVPATDCTFDGGVLALSEGFVACVWFGDED